MTPPTRPVPRYAQAFGWAVVICLVALLGAGVVWVWRAVLA